MPRFLILLSILLFAAPSFAQVSRWQSEGWKTDFTKLSVAPDEILSGGPPKDGIPPIDKPIFEPVGKITDLTDHDPVIGLSINGDARAYPLRVMTWHEIVNDIVGGQAVIITYCPLCNAAIVFDATVDGEPLSFGTTGKLRNSDLIMYDRKTESWWQQFTGTAIAGSNMGKKLSLLPARLESWKNFKTRHPNGKVLVPNDPQFRQYGRNPYVNYDISSTPFLYKGSMPDGISPMERVVIVREDQGKPVIISLALIRKNKKLERDGLTITWQSGQASALHSEEIAKGRDVGGIVVTSAADNRDLPYDVTFAFVAHAFHPKIPIQQK